MEIKVSEKAMEKIKAAIKDNNKESQLRIYVESAGCHGAKFGIAFDGPQDDDEVTEVDGVKFVTDAVYIPLYSDGIDIDYVTVPSEGFMIKSLNPVAGGCSSCSGCGH